MLETTHFLDIDDLTTTELHHVLDRAAAIKAGKEDPRLEDQTLGMLFEKPSTRTRISFETGMTQLGGHAIFLGPEDIQLGHGEPLSDTSRVLSRYVDVVMARLFDHEDLVEIADYADVPVVNGLTDDAHPCQTLADLLTIREAFGGFEDVQAAWVGDGNNVGQSFVLGCAMAGLDLTVATPEEYGIDEEVLAHAAEYGGEPTIAETPAQAVADADVVYTDVWISMGQEDERDEKIAAFEGYQVNEGLLAETDAEVMHCLPAHRGEEISHDVLESDRALVWDQAENRLHAQKGLLVELLNK
ncbi:ornithine carbamoyltransferase [Halogeometricum borinquense DSM 11551]|uniref:Ornithine carbamoyltransferase n=1 Tax=Halogeometricum borinquense (strain ATCC 700274 / DSM 11551 / JCM 10706 / KCTC 4070 / PR3) TaxID=469382 RepID=E4NSA4_HALBP|nr:ornithine carbamoyltransferase [Halogeometricum borinquense]ADQ65789.1 ornithine carbamoyltransferase [Halogeometricum borinquense DSM 11551]ELY26792.1 ornithine carbamoyltransferase [Halogeometricum borinquense DSM 11551]